MHQKALIVTTGSKRTKGLDELNIALERGWRVVTVAPMGGSGAAKDEPRFAALVVIERGDEAANVMLQAVEEEADEIVEGDGASADVADDFGEERPRP